MNTPWNEESYIIACELAFQKERRRVAIPLPINACIRLDAVFLPTRPHLHPEFFHLNPPVISELNLLGFASRHGVLPLQKSNQNSCAWHSAPE